ncbi:hypothetical protein Taro_042499 [Colocasia esculenta]|uniref:Uncharacterized protein n=1 Tax=Colocasia esculenta TaxID=4460 RepID=A0A843WH14_COLES|nr:hypothetical protein [Colocasia esculenta]
MSSHQSLEVVETDKGKSGGKERKGKGKVAALGLPYFYRWTSHVNTLKQKRGPKPAGTQDINDNIECHQSRCRRHSQCR